MTPGALLFDLDDTLIPEWEGIDAAFEAVARQAFGDRSAAHVLELLGSVGAIWEDAAPADYCDRIHLDLGEGMYGELAGSGPEAEVARAASALLERRGFDDAVPTQWRQRSPELIATWRRARIEALTVYPETLEVLEQWSARLPLALVTNGASVLQRRKVAATGLARFFSVIVVSEEVGVGKPAPAMFDAALGELGIDAADAVMIGNDVDRDVVGALATGIRPVWIRRPDAADGDLPSLQAVDEIADLRALRDLLA